MRRMFDASVPPTSAPAGFDAAAGYVGGDTPHVWTVQEWDRFAHLGKLPIWVRSNPASADPYRDAVEFDRALRALSVPHHCPVALDKETTNDEVYLKHFSAGIAVAGYRLMAQYESLSTYSSAQANGLAVVSEFWIADWTGVPHMFAKPVAAVQYASGTEWDSSMIRWSLFFDLWV